MPQMATVAKAQLILNQEIVLVFLAGAGSQGFVPTPTIFSAKSKELDRMWSNQDTIWHPYAILALAITVLANSAIGPGQREFCPLVHSPTS